MFTKDHERLIENLFYIHCVQSVDSVSKEVIAIISEEIVRYAKSLPILDSEELHKKQKELVAGDL